jgi:PAS domain S-box-containing protein
MLRCHTGAWDLDLTDYTTFRSLEHDRIFGYTKLLPSWTYEMFLEHVLPEDRTLVNDKFQHATETRSDWSFECRIRRVDGQIRWIWAAGRHQLDASGTARCMAGIVQDITELKQVEEEVRSLSQMLMNVQERERKMISYELHDRIAQNLSTLKIGYDMLFDGQSSISSESIAKTANLSKIIKEMISTVRDLSYDLQPPILGQFGIVYTLKKYCEEFSQNTGIKVDFQSPGIAKLNMDADTEIHLYRLVQEGLNNIRKHADSDKAIVRLLGVFPNIILRIEDTGKGFDVKAQKYQ